MKQILFRAISTAPESNGLIVYGSLVNLSKSGKPPFYQIREIRPDGKSNYIKIRQDSISQYIGEQDSQGKPIFEGDILHSQEQNIQFTVPTLGTWIILDCSNFTIIGNVYQ